jgi:hypothetical protein
MCNVQLDDTGSSKGLRSQHPTGESPRLQSVAPTESPYQRRGCYSTDVTDTLLTFSLSEAHQPCRWAFALPSCTFKLRSIPPEGSLSRLSRCSKVSIRQSPGRTPRSPPNPLEAAHLLPSLYRLRAAPPTSKLDESPAPESAARTQPPQSGTETRPQHAIPVIPNTHAWTYSAQAQNTPAAWPDAGSTTRMATEVATREISPPSQTGSVPNQGCSQQSDPKTGRTASIPG